MLKKIALGLLCLIVMFAAILSCEKFQKHKKSDLDKAVDLFYEENKNDSVLFYLNINSNNKYSIENKFLAKIIHAAALCESEKILEAEKVLNNTYFDRSNMYLLCWYNSIKGLILFRQNKFSASYNYLIKAISNKEIDKRTLALNERIIARIFLALGDDKNTLEYFLLSNKHFQKAGLVKSQAINFKFLGRYALINNDHTKALNYFKKSEKIFIKYHDNFELFYVYINILDFHIIKKEFEKAKF